MGKTSSCCSSSRIKSRKWVINKEWKIKVIRFFCTIQPSDLLPMVSTQTICYTDWLWHVQYVGTLRVSLSPRSCPCRAALTEVQTARVPTPSGLAAQTPTATMTLMRGTASGHGPAPTPALWVAASPPSCPRTTSGRPTCIWATQEPLGPRWQPRCPVWQRWRALWDTVLRTSWRTFWTTWTCSRPTTLRSEEGPRPPAPPSPPPLLWCSRAPATRPTAPPAWSHSLSRSTASACTAKQEWTRCRPCRCRACQRVSPASGPRWASTAAQQGFWRSCWRQIQTSTAIWCRQWTLWCLSPAEAACCHRTAAPSMQPN